MYASSMGRPLRPTAGGYIYHALNRANAQIPLFQKADDYQAFEQVMSEARARTGMRILAYCVMPTHWHFVLWPRHDGDLSEFAGWLALTHTQRWHAYQHTTGAGHVYQGRFKSFIVQSDEHLLTVCRYVERNALRANLVKRAENWRWCSLWRHKFGDAKAKSLLYDWPLPRPSNWLSIVNRPENTEEIEALRQSVNRGRPFGNVLWVRRTAKRLDIMSTLNPRGRPRKARSKGI